MALVILVDGHSSQFDLKVLRLAFPWYLLSILLTNGRQLQPHSSLLPLCLLVKGQLALHRPHQIVSLEVNLAGFPRVSIIEQAQLKVGRFVLAELHSELSVTL